MKMFLRLNSYGFLKCWYEQEKKWKDQNKTGGNSLLIKNIIYIMLFENVCIKWIKSAMTNNIICIMFL